MGGVRGGSKGGCPSGTAFGGPESSLTVAVSVRRSSWSGKAWLGKARSCRAWLWGAERSTTGVSRAWWRGRESEAVRPESQAGEMPCSHWGEWCAALMLVRHGRGRWQVRTPFLRGSAKGPRTPSNWKGRGERTAVERRWSRSVTATF